LQSWPSFSPNALAVSESTQNLAVTYMWWRQCLVLAIKRALGIRFEDAEQISQLSSAGIRFYRNVAEVVLRG